VDRRGRSAEFARGPGGVSNWRCRRLRCDGARPLAHGDRPISLSFGRGMDRPSAPAAISWTSIASETQLEPPVPKLKHDGNGLPCNGRLPSGSWAGRSRFLCGRGTGKDASTKPSSRDRPQQTAGLKVPASRPQSRAIHKQAWTGKVHQDRRRSLRPSYCARHGARGSNGLRPDAMARVGNPDMKPARKSAKSMANWAGRRKPHFCDELPRCAELPRCPIPLPFLAHTGPPPPPSPLRNDGVSCCISSTFLVSQDRSVPWIAAASPHQFRYSGPRLGH